MEQTTTPDRDTCLFLPAVPKPELDRASAVSLTESFLERNSKLYSLTGSYVIAPDEGFADVDFVVLVDNLEDFQGESSLPPLAFVSTSGDGYLHDSKHGVFGTLRSTNSEKSINLIVTEDLLFYAKFVEATKLATLLGLKDKAQRVALFQYILYGWMED